MAKVFDEIEITKEDGSKVKMKILFTPNSSVCWKMKRCITLWPTPLIRMETELPASRSRI